MTNATEGQITADGFDTVRDYRQARATIGLVPQELHTDAFENRDGPRSASAVACSARRPTRR